MYGECSIWDVQIKQEYVNGEKIACNVNDGDRKENIVRMFHQVKIWFQNRRTKWKKQGVWGKGGLNVKKSWENCCEMLRKFYNLIKFFQMRPIDIQFAVTTCPPDNRDNIWTMSAHLKFNSRFNILTLLQNTADTFFFIVAKINDQSTLNPHSKPTINMVLHYNAEGLRM